MAVTQNTSIGSRNYSFQNVGYADMKAMTPIIRFSIAMPENSKEDALK